MRSLFSFVLTGGLLLGGVVGGGCTSDSPGSTPPDTVATSAETETVADAGKTASSPPRSSVASESSRTLSQRLADASVAARIKQALADERALRAFNFFPEVVRGRVVLRGDVDTRDQYRRAERIAKTVEGVATVTNRVTVKGRAVSETDDASTASSTSDAVYHTVRRGDTLWEIAREYGVSIRQIRALNPSAASSLRPGERLRVQ